MFRAILIIFPYFYLLGLLLLHMVLVNYLSLDT